LHQFLQYCIGEAAEILCGDYKGPGTADHVAAIIAFEPRLLGQDRKTVDRDPCRDYPVARRRRRQAEIGHSVA
jgi:hypothetical protein